MISIVSQKKKKKQQPEHTLVVSKEKKNGMRMHVGANVNQDPRALGNGRPYPGLCADRQVSPLVTQSSF